MYVSFAFQKILFKVKIKSCS